MSGEFTIEELERAVAYWRNKIKTVERHKFMNPGLEYRNPGYYDRRIKTYEGELEKAMDVLDRAKITRSGHV